MEGATICTARIVIPIFAGLVPRNIRRVDTIDVSVIWGIAETDVVM